MIILNFNGAHYLDTCLDAVLGQQLSGGFEVILVDNGSTDGSVELVRRRHPQVRVLEMGCNLGFSEGNNRGLAVARGRHPVLLNTDTRVRPGWLQALVEAAEDDSRVGAVSSKLLFMERPHVVQNAGNVVLSDGTGGDRGSGEEDTGQYDLREEVFAACGGAALYRRAALEDVGLLDGAFFCYYEDTDLSWRMRLRGWRIVYEPAAVAEHVHAGTSKEGSPFFTFHTDRNRLFMVLKNARVQFVLASLAGFAWLSVRQAARALWNRRRREFRQLGCRTSGGVSTPGRTRIRARVLLSFLAHAPEMLSKRRQIRGSRTVSDQDIERWFAPRRT